MIKSSLNKGLSAPIVILLILLIGIILAGGFIAYQQLVLQKEIEKPEEGTEDETAVRKIYGLNLKTTKLAIILEDYKVLDIVFSPDGRNVAYVARVKKARGELFDIKYFVVVNKTEGRAYDEVSLSPIFSPDGKYLAYIAKEGKITKKGREKIFLVINNIVDKISEEILIFEGMPLVLNPIFSPDSKKIAYLTAKKRDQWIVVIRDIDSKTHKESKTYDSRPRGLTFSPDSKQVAYKILKGNQEFVVVGEKEGKIYQVDPLKIGIATGADKIIFSPDTKQVAYSAKERDKEFIVVGEKEDKAYDKVGVPVFSPGGKQIAYPAKRGQEWFIIVDGEERKVKESNIYNIRSLAFSPNGQQIGYVVDKIEPQVESFIIVGERKYKSYSVASIGLMEPFFISGIKGPFFSPDNKTVAYVVVSHKLKKSFVVINEKEGKRYDYIDWPIFSPDSKYVAFGVRDGNELWWIVEEVK